MRTFRRSLAAVVIIFAALLVAGSPVTADGQGDDNIAVAINTEDGSTAFDMSFSVRHVQDGVVDQTNTAVALASCTDCQTVALAFQVVLVSGVADVITPQNVALAVNDQCVGCVTYASATQLVLGYDGKVRLTGEGWRRLAALRASLRQLERDAPTLNVVELDARVQAAKAELVAVLSEAIVNVPAAS